MSYMALYRKYRPAQFQQVIGQKHIVKTLLNQLTSERTTHAYLFCGTRGTGKTSTAKLFAKAVNCQDPQQGEPCNHCESCAAIAENRSMNVVEIDAASNNGVDNIRQLRDEVRYAPAEGKAKVYIIDEVHMLSIGAFNALLKTLEEPPEHVLFILATTDPQKIPVTILSRCQRFDFKRITVEEITAELKKIAEKENILIQQEALQYIAYLSDGAMRDALSILDQCMSFYFEQHITKDMVLELLGAVDKSVFINMADCLIHYDGKKALDVVENIIGSGKEIKQFIEEFTKHLRDMLVVKTIDNQEELNYLDISHELMETLKAQTAQCSIERIIDFIKQFSALNNEMRYSNQERILLEVLLIKLCNPESLQDYGALISRLEKMEKNMNTPQIVYAPQPELTEEKVEKKKQFLKKAVKDDIKKALSAFKDIKNEYENPGFVKEVYADTLDDEIVYLICPTSIMCEILKDKMDFFEQAFSDQLGVTFRVKLIGKAEFDKIHMDKFGAPSTEQADEFIALANKFSGIQVEEIDE